jgi:hypothetical protein
MSASSSATQVKTVGSNGRISLGKRYAGRQVLVEAQEPGVWLVRTIPDHERWVHEPEAARSLHRGSAWAQENPPDDSNTEEVLARLGQI